MNRILVRGSGKEKKKPQETAQGIEVEYDKTKTDKTKTRIITKRLKIKKDFQWFWKIAGKGLFCSKVPCCEILYELIRQ